MQRARKVTTGAKEPQVSTPTLPPPGTPSGGGPEFESPTSTNWAAAGAVREEGRLADPSDLLDGAAHGVLLDDDGPPTRRKSRPRFPNCSLAGRTTPSGSAATSARAPRPSQAEQGAMGIIQSRTRQIRCYWYRWIIEGGMTKS
jgi:hypothetical protein